MYDGMVPVAVGSDQFEGSAMCGACVEVTGTGVGAGDTPISGTFLGYVSDYCKDCEYGGLELGKVGDGRWGVSWKVVECGGGPIGLHFGPSTKYAWKMQPRGMTSPASSVTVGGVPAKRTGRNYFIAKSKPGFKLPVKVIVKTVVGETITSQVNSYAGFVYPGETSTPVAKIEPVALSSDVEAPATEEPISTLPTSATADGAMDEGNRACTCIGVGPECWYALQENTEKACMASTGSDQQSVSCKSLCCEYCVKHMETAECQSATVKSVCCMLADPPCSGHQWWS